MFVISALFLISITQNYVVVTYFGNGAMYVTLSDNYIYIFHMHIICFMQKSRVTLIYQWSDFKLYFSFNEIEFYLENIHSKRNIMHSV